MNIKEQILQDKIKKKRKFVQKLIKQAGDFNLFFSKFKYPPTKQNFEEMVISSNYGFGDPLTSGGSNFAIEYIFDELNSALNDAHKGLCNTQYLYPDGKGISICTSQSEV
ncbi:MAG: hypothetical protein RIQ94_3031 [Pseudomonadota bacterium]|jgi:hypothetical protein